MKPLEDAQSTQCSSSSCRKVGADMKRFSFDLHLLHVHELHVARDHEGHVLDHMVRILQPAEDLHGHRCAERVSGR